MTSAEIRTRFLEFFKEHGHIIRASSSLVPQDDSSVLFTTAGMQQFKPYYSAPERAQADFGGLNIATVQKCVRTGDIDEVGDATHLTFFEMLGNFSFGGYGRKEAINYAHEFITKELELKISYVTFYKGEGAVPRDDESRRIWEECGIADIREDGADVFWGPTGTSGPCGPTTEIYCKNANGDDVEVWNIVFNEYFCDGSREALDAGTATLRKLDMLGIDTGMGFERLLATVQQKKSVYDTDLFVPLIAEIKHIADRNKFIGKEYDEKSARIIADHLRTSVFLIADGVLPGNKDQSYILRRLLRRAIRYAYDLGFSQGISSTNSDLSHLAEIIIGIYAGTPYSFELHQRANSIILKEIENEEQKFRKTLKEGLKEFEKLANRRFFGINGAEGEKITMLLGEDAFNLLQTYGFPIEMTIEEAAKKGLTVDVHDFEIYKQYHSEKSRTGAEQKFKGGLTNTSEMTTKLHTAHHLLLAALQQVLGPDVHQKGSNITEERLRIDFNFDRKLTDEEKARIETIVNDTIKADYQVIKREMPKADAEQLGAEMEFGTTYPDVVSVYFIEDANGSHISKEFCGGPHVTHTGALGTFKIQKEEASSAGIRRIKATLS